MFLSIDQFKFLKPILENRDIIFKEYNDYKRFIRSDISSELLKYHLNNMETYNLITSFVMCIATTNKIGSGQVTNGLFNFCYTMPDKNFLLLKPLIEKKFDINYICNSDENKKFFKNTLSLIKNIPKFTQCGYSEYKNKCIFDPHKHENSLIVSHFLLNPSDDELLITSNNDKMILNKDRNYSIFKGYETHSAVAKCKNNIITFGVGFYE